MASKQYTRANLEVTVDELSKVLWTYIKRYGVKKMAVIFNDISKVTVCPIAHMHYEMLFTNLSSELYQI